MKDQIPQLQAYLNGLDSDLRGVALTAVEIINSAFSNEIKKHESDIQENQQTLEKHGKRLSRLERELANTKLRVRELEAERGVLCL
ncbi:hypothetical protein [Marinomonas atlantica]|uniref:hypothetical protein n=1 Tax=Marinomonas atlantica TaxID=1806668 RepID=UPI0008369988|nr:hypothetical protein [Marinomonas atlantica]